MIDEAEQTDALARLVVGLLDRVDELGDAMAERIAAEANGYGECAVPMDDLRTSSRAELRDILDALSGLAPLDIEIGAETGRRRALQNVPEVTLLAGYRVGIRFVWDLVMAEAARTGLVGHEGLVEVASRIWDVQDGVIEAALAGHREATTDQLRAVEQQRSILLDALLTDQSPRTAMLRVATDVLRMPRRGDFVIAAAELPCVNRFPRALTGQSEDGLRRADIHSVWHLRPNARVGIIQLTARKRLDEVITILEGEAVGRMGVSPVYGDLYETGKHLRYAEVAMLSGRADGSAVTVFDDNLVAATAAAAPEVSRRLAREVFGPLDTLPPAEREGLLHTLETWLSCGGSTEETAKRLCCHPNTVRLRFKRINEHTGRSTFDPLEITELTVALHALRQAPDLLDPDH